MKNYSKTAFLFLLLLCFSGMAYADGFINMTSDDAGNTLGDKARAGRSSSSLVWQTSKADAIAAAKLEGKKILMVAGRETCGYTRYMRYTVCETTSPQVRCLIEQNFIPWYVDVDSSSEHYPYTDGLTEWTLPLICTIDPDDSENYLDRTTATQSPEEFYARLRSIAGEDCLTVTLSGSVKDSEGYGIPDVMLILSGSGGITTTDSTGYYTHEVTSGWSGTVDPYKLGYTFAPESRSYSDYTSEQNGQDYTGTQIPKQDYLLDIYSTGRVACLLMHPEEFGAWNGVPSDAYPKDKYKIAKFLYTHFEDDFDFIFLISNNDSYPDTTAYAGISYAVKNDVEGIGRSIFDSTSEYGSSGRLKSFIHLPRRNALENGPSLHEMLHAWASYVVETSYSGHWGFSSGAGQHGGFDRDTLVNLGNGIYQANNGKEGSTFFGENANGGNSLPYSDIELYLMGLLDKSEVSPLLVANEPAWLVPYEPGKFSASGFTEYTIGDIIEENGERKPSLAESQKQFRALTVILSAIPPTDAEWEEVDQDVQFLSYAGDDGSYLYNFWEATRGLASLKMDDLDLSGIQWIRGDINNDKDIDLEDAIIGLRVLAGIATSDVHSEADVDGDHRIGLADIAFVLRYLSGSR